MSSEPLPEAHNLTPFPIVALGASAGGLEAISELIAKIPAQCGMAFLVVQHLDPLRPSLLTDILAKHTALTVSEAIDGEVVQVNHLYVIPPNTSMTIAAGHLVLTARGAIAGQPMPVDDLLISLAKDQGANSIGIILSGSGSDGAIGMQALHDVGGITFAQDERTAKFSSMPLAAISLGGIDLVLAPADIAAELLRIGCHPFLLRHMQPSDNSAGEISEEYMARMFRALRSECNIDFSNYKRGTINRRVARRIALRDLDSIEHYITVLEAEPNEVRALCRDFLIRFTEFFRDPDAFTALNESVFTRFVAVEDANEPIRIWVPGCASGEEVYSIAISLLEFLSARAIHRAIQIFGTDISEDALEAARAGRYLESIARNVSSERLQRFFVREGEHYRIAKAVRDCCTFARQNVAHDPPFSRMDLISCRNLLIYLDPILQRRVMPLLHYALKPQGVLMLGLSESVGSSSDMFAPLAESKGKIYTRKILPGRAYAVPASAAPPAQRRIAPPVDATEASAEDHLRRQMDRIALEKYAPPCVVCDETMSIMEFRGDTAPYLLNPPGPPTTRLQKLARPGLLVPVREAIQQARSEDAPVRKDKFRIEGPYGVREIELLVVPVLPKQGEGRWFLIFFEATTPSAIVRPNGWSALKRILHWQGDGAAAARNAQLEIERLGNELRATREQMRAITDEHENALESLKSVEEEMLSSNEEFQSTNEELETAKEELQSINEELSTTNDELRYRNNELKIVHDAIAQERDYADAIVETMSEPMLVLEGNFRISRANRAFYECFKVTPSETLSTNLFAFRNGQWNQPALRRLLEEVLPQQTRVRDYEVFLPFANIGQRTMRVNAMRIAWPERELILLTIEDMTERQDAFERLRAGDRQKDQFLAMLAHELRNPLAAMQNALTILQRHGDASAQQLALNIFERQIGNQVSLVDDLLDVSRITRGLVELRIQRFDLTQTVRQAYESARSQIELRQLAVTLVLPIEGLAIEGDSIRLEQVVANLLGNAVKFTQLGGHIEIVLKQEGDQAVLSVIDNGVGMSAELLPTIFEVFIQAERTLDRSHGGLGMGLALVRRLVELHGGSVYAESAGLLLGSKFVVRLPALAADAAPLVPLTPKSEPRVHDGRRVLLVDDNLDALESGAAILAMDGHAVRTASNGPAALAIASTFRPDAVILDIGLPGMDGYEVCRRLRAMTGFEDTLIVALSGYGQAADLQQSTLAGFDRHLLKPADFAQVSELIDGCKAISAVTV